MFAGFDPDVVPAVQLQTAAADHHVEAEQGEGLRGGRAPAGVQEGKRRGRLFTPPPHLSPARPLTAFLSLSLCCRWPLCRATLADVSTSAAGRRRSASTRPPSLQPQDWSG